MKQNETNETKSISEISTVYRYYKLDHQNLINMLQCYVPLSACTK
jgi:hypothetical protein